MVSGPFRVLVEGLKEKGKRVRKWNITGVYFCNFIEYLNRANQSCLTGSVIVNFEIKEVWMWFKWNPGVVCEWDLPFLFICVLIWLFIFIHVCLCVIMLTSCVVFHCFCPFLIFHLSFNLRVLSFLISIADLLCKANMNTGSVLEYALAFTSAALDKYCTKWSAAPKTGFIDITTSKDFYRIFSGLQIVSENF